MKCLVSNSGKLAKTVNSNNLTVRENFGTIFVAHTSRKNTKSIIYRHLLIVLLFVFSSGVNAGSIKTLIVTGQNNHNWKVSHIALKKILENSGLFTVDVSVSPSEGEDMSDFLPDFKLYQLVVLDYNGDEWSAEMRKRFVEYAENGGGIVVYHAACAPFPQWREYNQIIGLGGWNGRDEKSGPWIYLENGKWVQDFSPGSAGSHGAQHEFVMNAGDRKHPIVEGLPEKWKHASDELYDRLRGPGAINVLYSAYSDKEKGGSGREEPLLFTVNYGKARIFHTAIGHAWSNNTTENNTAMQCAGFQITLLRGCEWAATGKVRQPVPNDFPTADKTSLRPDYRAIRWEVSDCLISLKHGDKTVWRFNADTSDASKPYFDPLCVAGGPSLTLPKPADHPWHLGHWFSWKYINGVNYWETDSDGRAQGETFWETPPKRELNRDGSARIVLDLGYRPRTGNASTLLCERREIVISAPADDGSYMLDWTQTFTAREDVILDRTPIPGEENGSEWGGYAGLAIRFSNELTGVKTVTTNPAAGVRSRTAGITEFYGATGAEQNGVIDGQEYGIAVLTHPDTPRNGDWYIIETKNFTYLNPATLLRARYELDKGKTLTLRHRVHVHRGRWNADKLTLAAEDYIANDK